jgi:hypothetical protein
VDVGGDPAYRLDRARRHIAHQIPEDYFEQVSASSPARRIGRSENVADAVLLAMTTTFLTV